VILWGQSPWSLVKVVTAFTVTHSLTLSLAALDIVRTPASVVEPLIAATIVFVAAENFFVHDIRRRWRATFVLGWVHRFGFAGALREYGLPDGTLVPGLAGFNIGVAIGQVAIVSLLTRNSPRSDGRAGFIPCRRHGWRDNDLPCAAQQRTCAPPTLASAD